VNEKPTHLDLFSGIGGFALAAGWAGFETVGFCDNEPYAQAVLKKHWPNVPIHGDIKTLDGTAYRGVTLLSGGFPCQPFSNAGKRRGKDDDRYLWPQMLRVIQEARPAWIVGENVAGIIGLALEQVCSDLEASGYDVEPIIIPACGVDAPHRRNRIWILANSKYNGQFANEKRKSIKDALQAEQKREDNSLHPSRTSGFSKAEHNVADSNGRQFIKCKSEEKQIQLFGESGERVRGVRWLAEPGVGRLANGIPNRVAKLKGLGNAIVPQVAYQIIKGIRELL
jgi:DNA (cytosine-5)-methyltransferase 1